MKNVLTLVMFFLAVAAFAQQQTAIPDQPAVEWLTEEDSAYVATSVNNDGQGIHQPSFLINDSELLSHNGSLPVPLSLQISNRLYIDFMLQGSNAIDCMLFNRVNLCISRFRFLQTPSAATLTLKMNGLAAGQYTLVFICPDKNFKLSYYFNKS